MIVYRKGKLYFTDPELSQLKEIAKRTHKSFKKIVLKALWRGIRNRDK